MLHSNATRGCASPWRHWATSWALPLAVDSPCCLGFEQECQTRTRSHIKYIQRNPQFLLRAVCVRVASPSIARPNNSSPQQRQTTYQPPFFARLLPRVGQLEPGCLAKRGSSAPRRCCHHAPAANRRQTVANWMLAWIQLGNSMGRHKHTTASPDAQDKSHDRPTAGRRLHNVTPIVDLIAPISLSLLEEDSRLQLSHPPIRARSEFHALF